MSANNSRRNSKQMMSRMCEDTLGISEEFYDPFKSEFFKDDVFFDDKSTDKNKNNSTYIYKTYCSSFNNMDGKEKRECYKSESFKQTKDGHDISESKEEYKNNDGVHKSAYQRELDGKKERFIKENNRKTGKKNSKKLLDGINDKDLKSFNKEYNSFSKESGFKKNMEGFLPFFENKRNNKYLNRMLLH